MVYTEMYSMVYCVDLGAGCAEVWTHRVCRPTEVPEGLVCVGALDLQGKAGSRTQLRHHALLETNYLFNYRSH